MPGPWQDDMQAVSAAIQQQGPQGAQIAQGPPMAPPPPGVQVPPQGAVPPGRAPVPPQLPPGRAGPPMAPPPGAPPPIVQQMEAAMRRYRAGDKQAYQQLQSILNNASDEERAQLQAWESAGAMRAFPPAQRR